MGDGSFLLSAILSGVVLLNEAKQPNSQQDSGLPEHMEPAPLPGRPRFCGAVGPKILRGTEQAATAAFCEANNTALRFWKP
jgi:hypothetical protein